MAPECKLKRMRDQLGAAFTLENRFETVKPTAMRRSALIPSKDMAWETDVIVRDLANAAEFTVLKMWAQSNASFSTKEASSR